MSIVSISEAARLTGKSRQTLHRHIVTGKLSKCNATAGALGVDTSELLRVYGNIKNITVTPVSNKKILQHITGSITQDTIEGNQSKNRIQQLEQELAILNVKVEEQEKRLEAKQETIESLKTALKLLEYRQEKSEPIVTPSPKVEPPSQTTPEPTETPVTGTATVVEPPETAIPSPTGFWSALKNLFK